MAGDHQSYDYFQHHAITVSEDRFARMTVKPHPRGGWTIADQAPGSTISTYSGNYPSEGVARQALAAQRVAAVQAYMAQKIRAGIAKTHPIPAPQMEMSLG